MRSSDVLKRIELLKPLLLAYPRSGMTADNIRVYAVALTLLSEAELKAAVLKCMRASKWFPSIAEIIDAAEGFRAEFVGGSVLTSAEAWAAVWRECAKKTHFMEPEFEDESVKEAVRLFGWREFFVIEEKTVGVARAQFMRMYESVLARGKEKKINSSIAALLTQKDKNSLLGSALLDKGGVKSE